MKTNFTIKAPFFPGFYESWALDSDSEYYECKEQADYYNEQLPEDSDVEFNGDDFELNYLEYKKDFCTEYVNVIKAYLPEEIVKGVEYESIWSPSDYNPWRNGGHTDELSINIYLEDNWYDIMMQSIDENYDWYADRIKNDWTSCDGFWSFMDNDVDDWKKRLADPEEQRLECYIECMLTYMMLLGDKNVKECIMLDTMDNIYLGSYIELTEDGKKKLQESKK